MINSMVVEKKTPSKTGLITKIAFQNKDKTITWYEITYPEKKYLVSSEEIIFISKQLKLF